MRTLAAIFAHPDDETFSMAATISHYVQAGVACHLFCATDGEAGKSSAVPVASPAELGTLRRRELAEAARLLGLSEVRLCGHPDGRLKTVDGDLLVGEVVEFIRDYRPQVVVTFGPEGAPNAHADHRAISRAATAAFFLAGLSTAYPEQLSPGRATHQPSRLYYVAWDALAERARNSVQSVPPTVRIDIGRWSDRKRAAFRLHATQKVHEAEFERDAMTSHEAFALAAGTPQPAPVTDDLFAGL